MDISDLQTFAMIGTAGRHHVTINMPIPTKAAILAQYMGSQHFYKFTNISNVTMKNILINYVSVSFEGKDFYMTNANFYGYTNFTSLYRSVINITGSSALFDDCTFQQNSFLHYQSNAVITIHDCTFHSYNHMLHSAISGLNSTLNLSGSVYFINNTVGSPTSNYPVCGAAIFLSYSSKSLDHFYIPRSILNINDEASVYFINNTADCGGAIFLCNTAMNVGNKVNMKFCENKARKWRQVHTIKLVGYYFIGGAVLLDNSYISSTGLNITLHFNNNSAGGSGGAIFLWYQSEIRLNSHTVVTFTSNVATAYGGAISMKHSNIRITSNTVVHFLHNTVTRNGGGALYIELSHLFIYKSVLFIRNNSALSYAGGGIFMYRSNISVNEHSEIYLAANLAHLQGGAIYQLLGGFLSIDSHSILTFCNNSASQGGAVYLPPSATINVGNDSVVLFVNNSVSHRGGAVYANFQFDLPCFLVLISYSGVVIFEGNVAKKGIGMDVYGASIRSSACAAQ